MAIIRVEIFFLISNNKSFSSNKYSWGNSISFHKIQSDMVFLPVKNGEIDFDFMRTIISAVHKLVIKEVFLHADRKSKATRKGVSNNK